MIRRPSSVATAIACVALFFSMGGVAQARHPFSLREIRQIAVEYNQHKLPHRYDRHVRVGFCRWIWREEALCYLHAPTRMNGRKVITRGVFPMKIGTYGIVDPLVNIWRIFADGF
jgi:hypothetical protein